MPLRVFHAVAGQTSPDVIFSPGNSAVATPMQMPLSSALLPATHEGTFALLSTDPVPCPFP